MQLLARGASNDSGLCLSMRVCRYVDSLISAEIESGISSEHIMVGGFSQGINYLIQHVFHWYTMLRPDLGYLCPWLIPNPDATCCPVHTSNATLCQHCNALCRWCHGAVGAALTAQACRDCCSERVPPAEAVPAAHSSGEHGHARADVPRRCRPNCEWSPFPCSVIFVSRRFVVFSKMELFYNRCLFVHHTSDL